MGGMKQGSGDLSFGEEEDKDESPEPESSEEPEEVESAGSEVEIDETVEEPDGDDAGSPATSTSTEEARSSSGRSSSRYPYFVRRSNVGDERDNRFELFARDEVVSKESEFRSQLAAELGTDDVAKTDAREYALLAAYNNVEEVAELMREDGYGELDQLLVASTFTPGPLRFYPQYSKLSHTRCETSKSAGDTEAGRSDLTARTVMA